MPVSAFVAPGPVVAQQDAEPPGHPGVAVGHERGAFLVFGDHGPDFAAGEHRFVKGHQGAARDAENGVDPFLFQISKQQLDGGAGGGPRQGPGVPPARGFGLRGSAHRTLPKASPRPKSPARADSQNRTAAGGQAARPTHRVNVKPRRAQGRGGTGRCARPQRPGGSATNAFRRARSTSRNSFHSVASTTASTPRAAYVGVAAKTHVLQKGPRLGHGHRVVGVDAPRPRPGFAR
jgi:hypothetical protein